MFCARSGPPWGFLYKVLPPPKAFWLHSLMEMDIRPRRPTRTSSRPRAEPGSWAAWCDGCVRGVRAVPRWIAVCLTLAFMLGVIVLFGTIIANSFAHFSKELPKYEKEFNRIYNATTAWIGKSGNKQLEGMFSAQRIMGWVGPLLQGVVDITAHVVSELFMIVIFLGYALLSRIRPKYGLAGQIDQRIQLYIRLKTMVCVLVGVLVAIIFYALQIDLAGVFGLMTFVLNYIPNVGAFIAVFVPMPIVILDPNLSVAQKVLAFLLPTAVHTVGELGLGLSVNVAMAKPNGALSRLCWP